MLAVSKVGDRRFRVRLTSSSQRGNHAIADCGKKARFRDRSGARADAKSASAFVPPSPLSLDQVPRMNRSALPVSRGMIGLILLVAIGAALHFGYNNVVRYGNGDEYHYRLQLQEIYNRGFQAYP